MSKKSLFKASFEESLNLEDDGILQFHKRDVFARLEKLYRDGKPTVGLVIQNILLTVFGPIVINFMLYVFSLSFYDSEQLKLPIYKHQLLTVEIYLICFLLWLILVLIGKYIRKAFLLPYRNHFHVITFIIWLWLEFNLLALEVFLPTLSLLGVIILYTFILLMMLLMVSIEVKNVKKHLYHSVGTASLFDYVIKLLLKYGTPILGIILLFKFFREGYLSEVSTLINGIGIILMWVLLNILVAAFIIFMEFPSYLNAYYKWKYSEEYREWEEKSLEEWYGKKYLKKHQELLKREG